jgi:hypothetical protein
LLLGRLCTGCRRKVSAGARLERVNLLEDEPRALRVAGDAVDDRRRQPRRRRGAADVIHEARRKVLGRVAQVDELLALDGHAVHAVLAVEELYDRAHAVAHGVVIVDGEVFERLDEAALDVARVRSLDGGVDEALAAAHRVEEELLRREALEVRVLDKAPAATLGAQHRSERPAAL